MKTYNNYIKENDNIDDKLFIEFSHMYNLKILFDFSDQRNLDKLFYVFDGICYFIYDIGSESFHINSAEMWE